MVDLLQELVDIDSGSYDKNGVDAVGVRLGQFLAGHGITTATMPIKGFGNTFLSGTEAVRRDRQRHNFLLLGHRDTVFGNRAEELRPSHCSHPVHGSTPDFARCRKVAGFFHSARNDQRRERLGVWPMLLPPSVNVGSIARLGSRRGGLFCV
ncbi:hypothetical protein [Mesorhizobium sp. ORM16]|uniref:hypothetical protein n=1 Tax=Mesorhizobium sp. ORM16 TaxID=3376989 RepID=UPI003857602C